MSGPEVNMNSPVHNRNTLNSYRVSKKSAPKACRLESRARKADLTTTLDGQIPPPARRKVTSPNLNKALGKASSEKKSAAKSAEENAEKRLRRFRNHAPLSYLQRLERSQTQRMFVIDRRRCGSPGCPEEKIDLAGTTGNVYQIHIAQLPNCTCPDNRKGNQCKHIVYVLHHVLRAPCSLQYQLAFLSSELCQIFANAPCPIEAPSLDSSAAPSDNRKPIEGDCPICFMEFDPTSQDIEWCRAACGNNVHSDCFEQWAKSQEGREVRCVYCRSIWQGDEEQIKRICRQKVSLEESGLLNAEGYVNVGRELGYSAHRDDSTYHFWGRQRGQYS